MYFAHPSVVKFVITITVIKVSFKITQIYILKGVNGGLIVIKILLTKRKNKQSPFRMGQSCITVMKLRKANVLRG